MFFLVLFFSYEMEGKTFLVFGGKTGWIGKKIVKLIQESSHTAICAESRLENRESIIAEIEKYKPDFIINAAGITGRPNIDWCETHRQETIRVNVLGAVNVVDIAYSHAIHVTNISTGCIYEYDDRHPMWSGVGFTEQEEPNFTGSFYSATKIMLEKMILEYPNVLNLRVKMPISIDMDKGFVAKIIKYEKVVNIPNSLCVLDDLLPKALDMTVRGIKGNFNFVNPGTLSHNQVLELYKEYVDPSFTWKNFSLEEHNRILKARRANAELSAKKLLQLYPDILPVKDALIAVFKEIRRLKDQKVL